jgi:hypothetical protein
VKDRDPSPRFVITTVFLFVVLTISAITFEYSPSQHTIIQQEALAQPASSFLTYDNPTHGIKMQYPADWTVSTNGLQSYSDIVGFFSPLQNLTDVLPAQVALSVMSYSANVSLDEYTNMTLTEIEQQGLEVNESNAFTLAGNPGHRIIFTPPPQAVPVSLSVMQVWTVINDKVYLLAYTAEGSEFQNNLSLVQQMLDSLQVQPKQKP